MCGIAGFFSTTNNSKEQAQKTLADMSSSLLHRGPDASGQWVSAEGRIGLAHQRLSIVDLSEAGKQPMESERHVLVFNGEIYNFRDIRKSLLELGITFRGSSDTEVLLYAIDKWGIKTTLSKLEGMYAFCVYDKFEKRAYLARDRMGEKPLYYSIQKDFFLFASELKAVKKHPTFQPNVCQKALNLYFKHNCIPAPYSVYQNTYKLLPGHYLKLDTDSLDFESYCYWSAEDAFRKGMQLAFQGSPHEAADQLNALLTNSIRDQMLADVPLGAFLSGGIDSSVVTAIMQSLSPTPINTFSIGFDFHKFNEAEHAKSIAKHLGTHHTELYVSEQDTKNVIPLLPTIYDEPFADSSQIPTYLVCKMARSHVTVALSGDGGDELFAGYSRYHQILKQRAALSRPTGKLKQGLKTLLIGLPTPAINALLTPALKLTGKYHKHAGTRLKANAWVAQQSGLTDYYSSSISFWHPNSHLLRHPIAPEYALNNQNLNSLDLSDLRTMQYMDTQMYLPDDILTKVDRAGMAVSLETRIPLLNHNIVEFAATLPDHINTYQGKAKWPLQEVLSRYVPRKLFERPKQGFAIPIGEWLKGPLNEWMMDLLNESTLEHQGLLNYSAIKPILEMHLDGNSDYSLNLWSILMLQAWLQENKTSA